MRTYFECIPCFARQALNVARLVDDDIGVQETVLRRSLALLSEIDLRQPPPVMARLMHAAIHEITGIEDPYAQIKANMNDFALRLVPDLRNRIAESADSLGTALRLAIAGNIIDSGIGGNVDDDEAHDAIDRALSDPLDGDVSAFRQTVEAARKILYLADNAGEIVLDRLLIEHLPRERITVAVRGGPALNDALRADAEIAGLTEIVRVIDNGSNAPGTHLPDCSPGFVESFDRADLVIAKGQGNYETLSDGRKGIFFLLKVKCPVIARNVGAEIGSLVLRRS